MDWYRVLIEIISSSSEWFISNGIWFVFILVFLEQFVVISNYSQGFFAIILMTFFAYSGHFSITEVIVVSCAASLIGTNVQFFLARKYRERVLSFLNRFPRIIDIEKIKSIKIQGGLIVISYVVAQLRGPVSFIAGTTRMNLEVWLLYSTSGIVLWIALSMAIGWGAASLFNGNLEQAFVWAWNLNRDTLSWIFLAISFIVLAFLWRKLRTKRS